MNIIYTKGKNGNDSETIISFFEGTMVIEQRIRDSRETTNDVIILDKEQIEFVLEIIAENMLMESL